ncbi:MAG: UDP-N-acetylenolpyruvoylglucosamine reductase [Candidatus Sungbacteria bacterium RIFCSPLOWO2_12_FULL_41_11]|uniref:UDP-N-acetylenolpyruvoylglucosamine reductase n=1 Tax=Candidatus Sungbacteria bacterium RIFCSPLOWO2_12_FULL_41_11 TaxID=1802286 RepID=A0A1G2LP62_9BACT|nr:MAG: UDP-N-acetylenolpyruvoylglucosamine reductase [Parcubacteria group bacterium GW2011_GWA2_42_14]OGZ99793.1 MAG: UDP-N-acetylenolpyruvoylglucosamine reductase [Candidatus Sungbacteria bacterium RIFCSPHIGHO2_02_FULL_41_12b]OHA12679.1 MAG: UDP-N-acetylenolpyruvoylglucosamine reductase [Candidatus Sungbacteria bacterium RIFCSPLOWO2_12_FULL_41_11]
MFRKGILIIAYQYIGNMTVEIKENINLSDFSVFKIGGPARFFVVVKSEDDLSEVLNLAKDKKLPIFILGSGSNILVSDKGFDGLVIKMDLQDLRIEDKKVYSSSGVSMARVVNESIKAGLGGFEWGIGIPGTIGGSVRGNAGCFGNEMKDVVDTVWAINTKDFQKSIFTNTECDFHYRDSYFKHSSSFVIVSAVLTLPPGDLWASRKKILEYTTHRSETQDIGTKSAGCIFKNIPWEDVKNKQVVLKEFIDLQQFLNRSTLPASYLIDQAGLKNKKIGKVYVSPKHANYIINERGGTAEEVRMLIALIKERVHTKYNIFLEEEIQLVGF